MNKTSIEWTDATWNPIRGCSRVSEGCRNCYAEKVAYRFSGEGQPYEGLATKVNGHASWTGKVEFVEKHLLDPLKWGPVRELVAGAEGPEGQRAKAPTRERPRRIFVNSMSDLFHENVPDEWIDRIFAVMALYPQHTFQILTKRPERMLKYLNSMPRGANVETCKLVQQHWPRLEKMPSGLHWDVKELPFYVVGEIQWPLPNVWLGVSVESQKHKDRIDSLRDTPAAVRFLSLEPLLEDLGEVDLTSIDWVICGGESGPGARPMHPDWARSLRDQCQAAGVPFFFKQHGEWISLCDYDPFVLGKDTKRYEHQFAWRTGEKNDEELPISCFRVGKKAAAALLDGREWREFPEVRT